MQSKRHAEQMPAGRFNIANLLHLWNPQRPPLRLQLELTSALQHENSFTSANLKIVPHGKLVCNTDPSVTIRQ